MKENPGPKQQPVGPTQGREEPYYVVLEESWPAGPLHHRYTIRILDQQGVSQLTDVGLIIRPLKDYADKYWVIVAPSTAFVSWPFPDGPRYSPGTWDRNTEWEFAASTAEIEYILEQGFGVKVAWGPYETRAGADSCIDLSWEAPDE